MGRAQSRKINVHSRGHQGGNPQRTPGSARARKRKGHLRAASRTAVSMEQDRTFRETVASHSNQEQ
eukprot:1912530-Rhodomonas_salina.1